MTRKEEREQASNLVFKIKLCPRTAFIRGAEWADKNPKEGLWDADKTCQIIDEVINSDTIGQYLIFDDENIDFDSELFFDDLRKAMED